MVSREVKLWSVADLKIWRWRRGQGMDELIPNGVAVQEDYAGGIAPAGTASVPPEVVIEPRRGWLSINFREVWQYRELLGFLTWRDVKVRYKQTVLGVLWAFLQPFVKLVVFSLVFGKLGKFDSEGYPYAIFLYAALLPWQFFAEAVTRSSQSIVNAKIITKVYFPRLMIPLASVGSCLIDFCIAFLILVGLMLYYGTAPGTQMLMVIPLMLVTVVAALGVGTLISALNVAYRDFRYVIPFVVQIWMFLTPVVYSVDEIPDRARWIVAMNPMGYIVDGYRSAILGKPFAWGYLGVSVGVCILAMLVSSLYFRRIERRLADII